MLEGNTHGLAETPFNVLHRRAEVRKRRRRQRLLRIGLLAAVLVAVLALLTDVFDGMGAPGPRAVSSQVFPGRLLIDGEWVEAASGKTFETLNPATEEILGRVAHGAANGIFFNQGQCCNAGSRLYIERDVYDEVVQGISDEAKEIKVGPGLDPDTQMGPLTSAEQRDKVLGYMASGLDAGAHAPAGGGRTGDRGYFVEPTVLTDTTPDMKVVREEIFGPVVCAIPFSSEDDDAIRSGNDTSFGLASGIWTRDLNKAHRTAHRLRAGTVWINCYSVFDAAMPVGGYKESGWGREIGHNGLDNYLETKSVVAQLA